MSEESDQCDLSDQFTNLKQVQIRIKQKIIALFSLCIACIVFMSVTEEPSKKYIFIKLHKEGERQEVIANTMKCSRKGI